MYSDKYNQRMKERYKNLRHRERPLLSRLRKFCDSYILTGDIVGSARLAGYPEGSANPYKALKNPRVIKYIKGKQSLMDKEFKSTFGWKIKKCEVIIDSIVGDTPDTVDKQHAHTAVSTIAELNRMQGHHAAEKHVNVNIAENEYIKAVNDLTMSMLETKRNDIKFIECDAD